MYSITISHKILCLAAKYSNKEFISSAVILCFEEGPNHHKQHRDSGEIINLPLMTTESKFFKL